MVAAADSEVVGVASWGSRAGASSGIDRPLQRHRRILRGSSNLGSGRGHRRQYGGGGKKRVTVGNVKCKHM